MEPTWQSDAARWRRFEEWEEARLREAQHDFSARLAWMADAWEIASRHSPYWNSQESAAEHLSHLSEIQRRLARAGRRG